MAEGGGWGAVSKILHQFGLNIRGGGSQQLFSVKYLFGEAKIAYNFLLLEDG